MRQLETKKQHCDVFEEQIDQIKFSKASIRNLDPWSQQIISMVIQEGLSWELGDLAIRKAGSKTPPSLIFRLDFPGISYIETYPYNETYMWIKDKEHHESIHPNTALAMLVSARAQGKKVIDVVCDDGTSILQVGNLVLRDDRTTEDRNMENERREKEIEEEHE